MSIQEELEIAVENMSLYQLTRIMFTDQLTNVYNRHALELMGYDCNTHCGIVDLDSLKYLNDQFGHRVGDVHLAQLANALQEEFGEDHVFRLSGDEFLVAKLSFSRMGRGLKKVRDLIPGISYGLGVGLEDADIGLRKDKTRRLAAGTRAARGKRPPWLPKKRTAAFYEDALCQVALGS